MKLSHVEAAILVGGASERMGRDKASLEWRGKPLAQHVADTLCACVERVSQVHRPGTVPPLDLPCIEDQAEVRAPLAGVQAALRACEAPAVLVVGCDMPLIQPALVYALLALAPCNDDVQIIAPEGPAGPEPLLAIYRKTLLPEIDRRIEGGELALHRLLAAVDTRTIPEAELRALDPELRSFRNLNREADLQPRP